MGCRGRRVWTFVFLTLMLVLAAACIQQVLAQTPDAAGSVGSPDSQSRFAWRLLVKSGWVGLLIVLVAFVMLTLVIYYFMTIRRSVFLPADLLAEVAEHARKRDYDQVLLLCREDTSLISRVLAAGLARRDRSYQAMTDAMEDVGRTEATRLHQNIGYLALIGNVAPMLGLLGTVTGMIRSFHTVAEYAGNVQPGKLAEGIYEALVTTFQGLVVAIPALVFFVYFRNRIVSLLDETASVA